MVGIKAQPLKVEWLIVLEENIHIWQAWKTTIDRKRSNCLQTSCIPKKTFLIRKTKGRCTSSPDEMPLVKGPTGL